jgi:hypothetical protein
VRRRNIVAVAAAAVVIAAWGTTAGLVLTSSSGPAWCAAANHEQITAAEPRQLQTDLYDAQQQQATETAAPFIVSTNALAIMKRDGCPQ